MISRFKPGLSPRGFLALFSLNLKAKTKFEIDFSKQMKIKHSLVFPYGRSALLSVINALDLKDSEILISAYTCSVVAHAVTLSGNKPIFIDIDPKTFNPKENWIIERINEKTRAVVLSHNFGNPQDSKYIEEVLKRKSRDFGHKIWLINDCAHSFDATIYGNSVFDYGDVSVFGLNISKNLTCIFGGMASTNDEHLFEILKSQKVKEKYKNSLKKEIRDRIYFVSAYLAFRPLFYTVTYFLISHFKMFSKYTMKYHRDGLIRFPKDSQFDISNFAARIGIIQMKGYSKNRTLRQENANFYFSQLKMDTDNLMHFKSEFQPTFSHFPITVENKNIVIDYFAKKGIELGEVIQYSIPDLHEYKDFKVDEYPNAKYASMHTINLPIAHDKSKTKFIAEIYHNYRGAY